MSGDTGGNTGGNGYSRNTAGVAPACGPTGGEPPPPGVAPPLGKDPPGPRGENPETSKMEKQSVTKYSV